MVRPDPPVSWGLGWHEAREFLDGFVRLGSYCPVFQRRSLRLTEGTRFIQGHRDSKQLTPGTQSPPPCQDAKLALRGVPRRGGGAGPSLQRLEAPPWPPAPPSLPDREKPHRLSPGCYDFHADALGWMILRRGALPSTVPCLAASLAPTHPSQVLTGTTSDIAECPLRTKLSRWGSPALAQAKSLQL